MYDSCFRIGATVVLARSDPVQIDVEKLRIYKKNLSCRGEARLRSMSLKIVTQLRAKLRTIHRRVWRLQVPISIPLQPSYLCLCLVPFLRYSTSNNGMSLKSGYGLVTTRIYALYAVAIKSH